MISTMDNINLGCVRQAFGNSVYNWKIQEVCCEDLNGRISVVKTVNVFLVSAVLILMAIQTLPSTSFFEPYRGILNYVGVGLSVLEIIFLIVLLSFGFEEKAVQHKKAALSFRSIRDRYISLICDIVNETIDGKQVVDRRDALLNEFQTICNLAPQTTRSAYMKTRSRLKPFRKIGLLKGIACFVRDLFTDKEVNEEDFTINDEEIDAFLPRELRKGASLKG